MKISTSSSLLLLLLLGLSQANPIKKEGNDSKNKQPVRGILTANNGSSVLLLEGDLIAPKNRNAMKCYQESCKWKKSSNGQVVVAYQLSSEYDSSQRQVIENALKSFASISCVRFVPRTTESDYIDFVSRKGCYAHLGRQGGAQILSIHKTNCMSNKIVQHEVLHALGFQHEHIRSDRDQYVKINFANIPPSEHHNFIKADTNNLGTPFDYSSVMQYPRRGFAIDSNMDTITPIPNSNVAIGEATTFSKLDIQRLNLLYTC